MDGDVSIATVSQNAAAASSFRRVSLKGACEAKTSIPATDNIFDRADYTI